MDLEKNQDKKALEQKNQDLRPQYVPPNITTYTGEEIIEQIGPAQACSPSPCASFP